jgi:hypothetical protein
MPKRIQRKRTKGWRMPDGAVYVGRPTIFGNPFHVGIDAPGSFDATREFRRWLNVENSTGGGGLRRIALLARIIELRGRDLACFCPLDQSCHADVLLELANKE